MSDDLFKIDRSNRLPFGVVHDSEGNVSTFVDRLFRPIICAPGKWPRCKMELATVCDGAPLYGAKFLTTFFRADGQPSADPAVRQRLRELVNGCGVLRAELRRRAEMTSDHEPLPTKAREHADLVSQVFGEAAA
jgi:hypothetical protein